MGSAKCPFFYQERIQEPAGIWTFGLHQIHKEYKNFMQLWNQLFYQKHDFIWFYWKSKLCVTQENQCNLENPYSLTVFSAIPSLLLHRIDPDYISAQKDDSKESPFKRYLSKGPGFRLLEYLRDFITNLSYLRISFFLGYFIFQSLL